MTRGARRRCEQRGAGSLFVPHWRPRTGQEQDVSSKELGRELINALGRTAYESPLCPESRQVIASQRNDARCHEPDSCSAAKSITRSPRQRADEFAPLHPGAPATKNDPPRRKDLSGSL